MSGRLVYANGGHCPPFVAHEGRASSLPMPKGALVGVMPGLRYTANEVELDQGVALVCFTDGVTEAESAAGTRSRRNACFPCRCCELRPISRGPAAFRAAGTRHLLDGMPLADDCTLVAVRRPVRSGLR